MNRKSQDCSKITEFPNRSNLEIYMKVMQKLFSLTMLIAAAVFVQGCARKGVPGNIDVSKLSGYLASRPENTPAEAYHIKVTGLTAANYKSIRDALVTNPSKYVDLSATKLPDGITNMDNCFKDCTALVMPPEIPDSVTGMYACFLGCTSLVQSPEIPRNAVDMAHCFADCTSLKKPPVIPHDVGDMSFCFNGCKSLIQAPEIPNSVRDMSGCFKGCTALIQAPVIPGHVNNMGICFEGCTSLKNVQILTEECSLWGYCFRDCTAIERIEVPNKDIRTVIYSAIGNESVKGKIKAR